MPKLIPEILKDHVLPFNWDVNKVWALDEPVHQVPRSEFEYLLELPLWSSVPGHGLLFDTRPVDVIRDPNLSVYQTERLNQTGLEYPIEVLVIEGRRWILDGVHRIAKHFISNSSTLPVRFHSEKVISTIRLG